jgi:hypothetical protein
MGGNVSATARANEREKRRDIRRRTSQSFPIWETFLAGDPKKAPEAAEKQKVRVHPPEDRRQVVHHPDRKALADQKSEAPAHRSILRDRR